MKVKVTFELDLTKNITLNIENVNDMSRGLQELSSFLHGLHLHHLDMSIQHMVRSKNLDENTKKMMSSHYEADIAVSEQLFQNYQVEGTTEDGNHFVFTHKEPGYKETKTINGILQRE